MRVLVAILSVGMIARGVDYVSGNSYDMGRLWGDHLTIPELWGIACLIVAALALLGLALNRVGLVINAGIAGMAISVMFAVQVADMRMFLWPPEDVRIITDHLVTAATWLLASATIHYRRGVDRRKQTIMEEADG